MPFIPARQRLRAELDKLKRLLALKSACHATLTRAADEAQLLRDVCCHFVHVGEYSLAWVGLYEGTGVDLTVRPQVGCEAGSAAVCDPAWAEPGRRDCVSAVEFVLRARERPLGVLKVCSQEASAFDPEERDALDQLANDLSHGIMTLRTAAAHERMSLEVRKLSRAVEQSPVSVIITDLSGRIEYVNSTFTQITGFTMEDVRGRCPSILKSGLTPPEVYADLWRTIMSGQEWRGEILNRRKNGELFWERELITPLKNESGEMTHFVAVKEDVTAAKEAEAALRLRERAIESSSNGVMITAQEGQDHPIIYVNPAFERITGYAAAEALGRNGRFLARRDLDQLGLEEIRAALREQREGHAVVRNYRKDGELFWNELHVAPVLDERGRCVTHFISIINDVTDVMRYQEQLEHQANHDVLTGLANRNLLADRMLQAIGQARRNGRMAGVLMLDLDRFKLINDGFGHALGDQLLRQVADRLKHCVRDTDTVSRLGGDEFVIVVSDVATEEDVSMVAAKVLSALGCPFELEGKEIFVTPSIGISLFPRDGEHGETLLRNADVAMYRVKEHGRASYCLFMPDMNAPTRSRLDMEGGLRRALERDELRVYYQPKVDLLTSRIVGAEALIRWMNPQTGLVLPGDFIPLAEETGLILPIGEWVAKRVCGDLGRWLKHNGSAVPIAINISARQFRQEHLAQLVRKLLEQAGVPSGYLELELTESMVMHQADSAVSTLRELKALGVRLALDDFGTGYSSLSYLKRFPIDSVKIDRSFVRDITVDSDDAAIAHAVIVMAHTLGLKVTAEGVETEAQLSLLRRQGCDNYQGFYLSRALPREEFERLLFGRPI